jgi:hypothetical protein
MECKTKFVYEVVYPLVSFSGQEKKSFFVLLDKEMLEFNKT